MSDTPHVPWTAAKGGVLLAVKVTPRAARTQIVGIQLQADGRPALAVRVASPPVDGAANGALIAWLAKQLRVSRSAVSVRSGSTGRLKIVQIDGDAAGLAGALAALVDGDGG
ncbi:DUF167 domain-containing protein [Sphingomonas sp.]|uniref:DUF167 domain-containing protein n=1 Tax=Sphingomonas sp. TaxID=28214 RepID=UPI003B3B303A